MDVLRSKILTQAKMVALKCAKAGSAEQASLFASQEWFEPTKPIMDKQTIPVPLANAIEFGNMEINDVLFMAGAKMPDLRGSANYHRDILSSEEYEQSLDSSKK